MNKFYIATPIRLIFHETLDHTKRACECFKEHVDLSGSVRACVNEDAKEAYDNMIEDVENYIHTFWTTRENLVKVKDFTLIYNIEATDENGRFWAGHHTTSSVRLK